jgi:CTP:molybdopterin cytidylyltransferase MocA
LLERAVIALERAHVDPIIVVVGHAKEEVERFVRERGLAVELVENGDFHVGNGSSAFVGGSAAASRFVVVMADHIFDSETVLRVLESPEPFAIAVDRDPRFCDIEEATKVLLRDGRVTEIGRELDPCDGVDAGLAVCDPAVLATAERALAEGDGTWNDVKRRWLAEGRALAAADRCALGRRRHARRRRACRAPARAPGGREAARRSGLTPAQPAAVVASVVALRAGGAVAECGDRPRVRTHARRGGRARARLRMAVGVAGRRAPRPARLDRRRV